jgi:hypothetical protein
VSSQLKPFLLREAGIAALYASGVVLLAYVIGAVSDEGGVSGGVRLARILPVTAIAAGLGACGASHRSRIRGEFRAFSSLGGNVKHLCWSWSLGAATFALVATILILRGISLEGFLPPPPRAPEFQWNGSEFVSAELGLQLRAGVLSRLLEAIPFLPIRVASVTEQLQTRFFLALYLAVTSLSLAWLGASWKRHENTRRLILLACTIVSVSSLVLLSCASQRVPLYVIVILSVGIAMACTLGRTGVHSTKKRKPSTR